MLQRKLLSTALAGQAAVLALTVFLGLTPLAVSAIPECDFTGQPTPEQLAACQAASAAAASQAPESSVTQGAPAGAGDQGAAAAARGAEMEAKGKEMERQGALKQLAGLKKGIIGMEKGFLKIVAQYDSLAKSGSKIPEDIQAKIAKGKEIIQQVKAAKTPDEIQEGSTDELEAIMEDLGNGIGDLKQQAGMMKGLKNAVKGMKSALSMFDKQIVKLNQQKIAVPADIAENLKAVKDIITGVEANKSWDELSALGLDNIEELFNKLDDGRERIIMLARWPQVEKQLNSQLASMNKQAIKLAATAAKLKGGEVDVSEYVAKFSQAVADLKQVKSEAVAKVKAGAGTEAFTDLEDNFFGKIDETYENVRIVETMAGLNKFAAEFKKGYAAAQKQIAALVKKKVKVAEAQNLLNQYKAKGDSVLAMIKQKSLDEEAIMAAVDELESLRTSLTDKAIELAGGAVMPWEQGQPVLKEMALPKEFDQFAAKNAEKDLKEMKKTETEVIKPKEIIGGQSILIEAENESKSYLVPLANRPASNMKETNPSWRPAYLGTGDWYLAAKGEWLEYNIEVPADGLYQFWIRDYVDKYQAKGVRRIVVSFDGKTYGTFAEVDKVSTAARGDFGWHKAGAGITLTKGAHVLKVMKEDTTRGAAVLDAFYLTLGSETPAEK